MDAVALPRLLADVQTGGVPRACARGRLDMSRSPLVLPPEAAELIEQVRTLDAHARRMNEQLQGDLAGIRKAASSERADLNASARNSRRIAPRSKRCWRAASADSVSSPTRGRIPACSC